MTNKRKSKKTILITGGAGFIGSNLADLLLKKDFKVVVIDNFDPYYPSIYKKENIVSNINDSNYFFINLDIRDDKKLEKILIKYSPFYSIIHLGARPGVRLSTKYPEIYKSINIDGTKNLLNLLEKYKVRQLIFASSSSVYGKAQTPFKETSVLKPLSFYGYTKEEGEKICYKFHNLTKIPVTILRFFSVYGPRGRPDMAPYIFTKAAFENKIIHQFGNGLSARDWTNIKDITDGIYSAMTKTFPFEIINLGGNKPIFLNTLIKLIENISKKKIKRRLVANLNEEARITCADVSKAKKLLEWEANVDIENGMDNFIKWYRKNRSH